MLDGPEDLNRAVAVDCAFALVEVASVELRLAGTRSQRSAYRVVVKRRLRGTLPDEVALAHYGTSTLQAGDRALVGARDSRRFSEGWQAEYVAPLGEGDATIAADELEAKLVTLSSD
jgi:hypothetical protein